MITNKITEIRDIIQSIYGKDLHQKRQISLANAALGLLESESLFLHDIGEGLADLLKLNKKHATKQVDRLLSNPNYDIFELGKKWVPYIIGNRKELMIILDWTSFADDTQWMLSLNVLTAKGSSTPLLWKTVDQKRLKHNRARYEDELLSRLKEVLPSDVQITLVADRGFADQRFFAYLEQELKFKYIIRIKSNTTVTDMNGESKKAIDWLVRDGKIVNIKGGMITKENYLVKQVVCLKEPEMKAAWILVSNIEELTGREITRYYSKRWKIEPYFRDIKDSRYGCGLRATHIKSCERRDRLFLIIALCYVLLILLGQAGGTLGLDRLLKVNTVKTRTHSLYRQGKFYYAFFHNLKTEEQKQLVGQFGTFLSQHDFWLTAFGV